MLHNLRNRAADQKGFTLIELLVVILIIGILAAIAIPSFLAQRDKANDASAKSAARTAQTAAETYLTDSPTQNYEGLTPGELQELEVSLAEYAAGTEFTAASTTPFDGYTLSVTSSDTGNVFTITRDATGTVDRTCDTMGEGGCQENAAGTGGVW